MPKVYQNEILKLAHESSMGGHVGINKTYSKITKHFYWPQIRRCVAEFCKTYHICQMVGKPNQKIPEELLSHLSNGRETKPKDSRSSS